MGANGVQIGPAAMRENPTTQPLVSLAPGRTSMAGFSYPDIAGCSAPVTADGLRVYPPNQTAALFVPSTGIKECTGWSQERSMINPIGRESFVDHLMRIDQPPANEITSSHVKSS